MLILVQFVGDVPLPTQIPIQNAGATYPLTAVNQVTAQLVQNGVNVWTSERICTIDDIQSGIVQVNWVASDFANAGSYQLYLRVYWNTSANVQTLPPASLRIQNFPHLTSIPQAAPGDTPADATVHNLTVTGTTIGVGATPVVELTTANAIYAITSANGSVWVEAPNVTVLLPAPATLSGRRFSIGNINQTSTIVKTPSAGATLNGVDYSTTGLQLGGAYDSLDVETDGTVYRIV